MSHDHVMNTGKVIAILNAIFRHKCILFAEYLSVVEQTEPRVLFSYNLNETWNPVYANTTSDEFDGRRLFFEASVSELSSDS